MDKSIIQIASFDVDVDEKIILTIKYTDGNDKYGIFIHNIDNNQSKQINTIEDYNFNTVKLYNHDQILISHSDEVHLVDIKNDENDEYEYKELQKYYNSDYPGVIINDIIFYNKDGKNIIIIANERGIISFYEQFRCYSNKYECKSLHFDNNFDNFCREYSFDDKNMKTKQKLDRALSICSKFIDNECCKLELEKIGYEL